MSNSSALPSPYREAIDKLASTDLNPHISTISDEEHLTIAQEVLSNFYATKDGWSTAGNWSDEEAKLLRLSGSAADISKVATPYNLASIVGLYLTTLVGALEYKYGKSTKKPALLEKKKNVVDDDGCESEVYGPVEVNPMLPGNSFEVWTTPSDENDTTDYENGDTGKIAVVLGAGNQSFLALVDILDNILRHKRSVLVKHHPLRPWLSESFGIMLEPLVQRGYFSQVPDISNEATQALLSDPSVGHVHITGSYKTAQLIQQILQKAHPELSQDKINSMVTSELGCATPQIMDDGVYTELELQHAAQCIAFGKKANGGCNCLSAQVVVLSKNWAQKDAFRTKLLDELKRQPTAPCYYPGSIERKASMVDKCQKAGSKCTPTEAASVSDETNISEADQVVLVECGTPGEEGYNSHPLLEEAFSPILAIVELDHNKEDDDSYLLKTVIPFLNNKDNIFGSLSCSIYTPVSKGKEYTRKGLQNALSKLQYGSISVNQLNLFGYFTAAKGGMWGGHKLETKCQSGNGNIGDLYGIIGDKIGKAIVYGPSLENKPLFDLANNPPAIVFDVLMEIACAPGFITGMARILKMFVTKTVYGIVSYIPGWG